MTLSGSIPDVEIEQSVDLGALLGSGQLSLSAVDGNNAPADIAGLPVT